MFGKSLNKFIDPVQHKDGLRYIEDNILQGNGQKITNGSFDMNKIIGGISIANNTTAGDFRQ